MVASSPSSGYDREKMSGNLKTRAERTDSRLKPSLAMLKKEKGEHVTEGAFFLPVNSASGASYAGSRIPRLAAGFRKPGGA